MKRKRHTPEEIIKKASQLAEEEKAAAIAESEKLLIDLKTLELDYDELQTSLKSANAKIGRIEAEKKQRTTQEHLSIAEVAILERANIMGSIDPYEESLTTIGQPIAIPVYERLSELGFLEWDCAGLNPTNRYLLGHRGRAWFANRSRNV